MISLTQRLVSAGLLATAAFAASAQAPAPTAAPPAGPAAEHRMHKPHDGKHFERMQERRAKHLAELKTKLKLNASQEGAWSTFTAATQPPARPAQRPDRAAARAEFEKMTTPQRLERMQARQAERSARFAQRAEATKTFYAVLTPEQQKTFDTESMRRGHRGDHGHRGHQAPPAKG
ncbi:Spy/CpxP family protein refolding chaperone [Variovorax fucosicus]|uniref:Spy/CpxP family protein refolding chaperone n=1 Tax=Variovorax fucosicus TaxID=3053517 RepID=UPI0025781F00|nr:Spy/CpxP family protein refolding chaperone [Variovorax sp. J22G47]MDM0055114.1 Spy/CpxP family protein refolding chaperone [Variovorax sp. J22G47]